jgi:hypothetical protein
MCHTISTYVSLPRCQLTMHFCCPVAAACQNKHKYGTMRLLLGASFVPKFSLGVVDVLQYSPELKMLDDHVALQHFAAKGQFEGRHFKFKPC